MENSNEVIANRLKILEDTVNNAFAPINKERQNKVVKDQETMIYTINNRGISTQEDGTYVSWVNNQQSKNFHLKMECLIK